MAEHSQAEILTLPAGTRILTEGEVADGIYVLMAGKVAVTRTADDGHEVMLAELQPGEVFGEMSLIDNAPCSASVRASEEVRVKRMDRRQFFNIMQSDVLAVQSVLHALFRRMRAMNKRVAELEQQLLQQPAAAKNERAATAPVISPRPGTLVLIGQTEPARHALDDTHLVVDQFPFPIGRRPHALTASSWFFNDSLFIHDIPPYEVSRKHCRIDSERGGIFITDCESRLGTWVDGEHLGIHGKRDRIRLKPGTHELRLGTWDTDFVFQLIVP